MQPKTEVLKDKRMWASIGTVAAILLSKHAGVDLDADELAAVAAIIVGWVTNSARKEAQVAGAMAAGQVETKSDAIAAITGSAPKLLAFFLLLTCATAVAEQPRVVDVQRATILTPSAPGTTAVLDVHGGVWLSDEQALATGKELTELRAAKAKVEEQRDFAVKAIFAAALACFGLGFGTAKALELRKPPPR